MQPSSKTESTEVSRAMRAYTEDLSLPRQIGESSHFCILGVNNRTRFSLKIFLGGVFKKNAVQKMIYEMSLDLPEPNDFSSFQSLFASHGLKLTESVVREAAFTTLSRTSFTSMFGENEEPALHGLDENQKKAYSELLVEQLRSGEVVGPLHYACCWMMYAKYHPIENSKIGDFLAHDVFQAVKTGLLVNATNVTLNRAQDESRPSMDWFKTTIASLYESVSKTILFFYE